jgi:hypothetical protein
VTRRPGAPDVDTPLDLAGSLHDRSAIVISSHDAAAAAAAAVALGVAVSATRRVAIGDLTGDADAVYGLAGGEDAAGLAESFREGLGLNEIARPVAGNANLFVLPAGRGVRDEPALREGPRWTRLIRGFGEAGGLLVLVAPPDAPTLPVLGDAGAQLVWVGRARGVPPTPPLLATIGAAQSRGRPWWRIGGGRAIPARAVALAAAGTVLVAGGGAVVVARARLAPDGFVILPTRAAARQDSVPAATTVALAERLDPVDSAAFAAYAIDVMAASAATNANSWLRERDGDAAVPAGTIAVIAVRDGPQRVARWHKVIVGAWHDRHDADSALAALRRRGVVAKDGGSVVRLPYALLLADSASMERADAVRAVWQAKGVAAYTLRQANGSVRVYAGAFQTVAQGVTMAQVLRDAGGVPMMAYRTGRPD